MEKKTRKKSKLLTTLIITIVSITIISITIIGMTYFLNSINIEKTNNDKVNELKQSIEKSNSVILYKISNNQYVNEYGYIVTSNSSAIILQGLTLTDNQEKIETSLFTKLLTLYNTLKNNELINEVTKIDVSDLENVKIYINSENKIILIGNFENLNIKLMYARNIMKQETGKQGEIIVKDTNKAYFRESL